MIHVAWYELGRIQMANKPKVLYVVGPVDTHGQVDRISDVCYREQWDKPDRVVVPPLTQHSDDHRELTFAQREALNNAGRRKVELADEILVVNDGMFIDEQTKFEVDYALACGKEVRFETEPTPYTKDSGGVWSYSVPADFKYVPDAKENMKAPASAPGVLGNDVDLHEPTGTLDSPEPEGAIGKIPPPMNLQSAPAVPDHDPHEDETVDTEDDIPTESETEEGKSKRSHHKKK